MGVNSKDLRDYYYYKAKAHGFRARSAFKLLHINKDYNIFEGCRNIVDLCAAPGSWSQVLSSIKNAKIIAVDVQDMRPIENVTIIKDDITSQSCVDRICDFFDNSKADLIVLQPGS